MKSRMVSVGVALAAVGLWALASPLVSQSHEDPVGPSLERFEAHLEGWNLSFERKVQLDLKDGSTTWGHMCGTPPPTKEFLAESRAVLSVVSEETASFETQAATVAQIPVFFHVIQKSSGQGYLEDAQIHEQVQVMNRKYNSAGVQFFVQGIEDVVNNAWFKKCLPVTKKGKRNGKYFKMTRKLAVDPKSTVNVYTCRPFDTILGLGILAGWLPEGHKANAIVLHYLTLPGGPSKRYSLGITGVHEMGHYLGLWHTFHPGIDGMPIGCSGNGDEVADTPFEAKPAFVCKTRDTCPQPGKDPIRNFMDYTDDKCRRKFSKGQRKRMLDMTLFYRPGLFGLK